MKRILQIAASLRIGGAEKVARDIGLSLDPKEYEVHYIVFGDEVGAYEQELIAQGCKIFHWPFPSANYRSYMLALRDLMRKNQYDVVHAHTMFNIGWAMLAAKQCGVPIRVSHAHSALFNRRSFKTAVYEMLMRQMILRNASHLVACGDAAGIRLYGEKAYHDRGKCILNGIDTAAFTYRPEARARTRKSLGLQDAFVIGHVGHLMEVKNQSYLIRLLPVIIERKPNACLLLLGEGEDRPMLESLIRELHLESRVIMTGNVRNVADYLSAMDVFAFPSLYEGTPLSILEVQANGLPCVLSTNVPKDVFLTDLIQLIPLKNPEQWVDRLLNVPRKERKIYAEELYHKGLDIKYSMKQILDIYKGIKDDL